MLKKLTKLLLGSLLFLVIGLTGLNYLGINLDEEPITGIELLPLTKAPSEKNAFKAIRDVFDKKENIDWSTLSNYRGKSWDQSKVKKIVANNLVLLDQISSALEKDKFMTYPVDFDSNLPAYDRYVKLADLLIMHSRLLTGERKYDDALENIRLALKLSELVKADESAILISYAVGSSMEHRTLNWMHRLVSNNDLSLTQLSYLAGLFDLVPGFHSDQFEMIFSGEHAYAQTIPDDVLSPPFFERVNYLFDGTLEMRSAFGQSKGILIDVLSIPSYHFFFQKERTRNNHILLLNYFQSQMGKTYCNSVNYQAPVNESSIFDYLGMNAIGESNGLYDTWIHRRCFSNVYVQALKTIVALKRYSIENDIKAENLEQLVPKYLTHIPIDAFTGEPILFNYKSQTLYSRGMNSRDDGGQQESYTRSCEADKACADDPAISINIGMGNTMDNVE